MKLVLHIGTEKTGTTTLQDWLYTNQRAFSDQGVFLSNCLGKTNNRKLVAHFRQAPDEFWKLHGLETSNDKAEFFKGFLDDFKKEVEEGAKSHDVMVITSEHFHSRLVRDEEVEQLKIFLYQIFDEINIVCYLREQSQLRKSLYSTALKVANSKDFDKFQAAINEDWTYYNYHRLATRWSAQFGKKNINLRIYDPASFLCSDLRLDFLQTLPKQINTKSFDFELRSSNEGLSFLRAKAFQSINRHAPRFLEEGGLNRHNQIMKDIAAQISGLDEGEIRDYWKHEIAARFEQSNQLLSQEFFDGEPIFEKPCQESNGENEKTFTLEEVGTIVEELFATFTDVVGESRYQSLTDADFLRGLALKCESKAPVTREDARLIKEIATRIMPNNVPVQKKFKE